ncbi:peptidase [Bavariicoccus seileri]|uniref:peptidase n=1 Tax=Bavariicoccus seileri TaxID=549685 RepID=UPI0003B58E55|nr:peptidase [Bavariicoccus seileri]
MSLARVLVSPKPLIILDESFSNVDLETAQRMIAYLMSTEATIILITHRESELSNLNFEKVSLII